MRLYAAGFTDLQILAVTHNGLVENYSNHVFRFEQDGVLIKKVLRNLCHICPC